MLAQAINKAGSTEPAKIREAILAIRKFPGAEGEYNFDQNGDGLHGYNIVKNEKGDIVFDKHIEFNELIVAAGLPVRDPGRPHAFLVELSNSRPPNRTLVMDLVLQLLFTGIGIGAVYALVALGFVLIFRATNVVNFAQGEFSMVAAYLMVVFAVDLGWPYWLSFLLALAGMALLGVDLQSRRLLPAAPPHFLPVIIATIGASILLANSVLAIYGPQPQVLQGWFETPGIQLGPVYLDSQYLLIIAVTIAAGDLQYWFFEHTLLGKKLQATSQDKEMASLLGISVSAMIMITFIYSAVLGGLAGILVAPVLFVSIQMGSTIALKAFAATIIGGFGDVTGAIIGGLALGVIETFGAAYISVPYKDAFAFLVLVAVPDLPAAGHLRRTRGGKSMSAPSENMPMPAPVSVRQPLVLRHLPYFVGAAIAGGAGGRRCASTATSSTS